MEKKLLFTVLNKMGRLGRDAVVTNDRYSTFFAQGNAAAGVREIVASGEFYINGFAVPTAEAEFGVNAELWLKREENGWRVDRNVFPAYADAAFALIDRLPAGVDVQVFDCSGDGFADRIEVLHPDSLIAAELRKCEDGSFFLHRGSVDASLPTSEKDGEAFSGGIESCRVLPEHLDPAIRKGDMVLVTRRPDGWHAERAQEVRGVFTGGEDHHFYTVNGRRYPDAMRFSRGNVIISNRNGEFANAQAYFGFCSGAEEIEISFWLAPTADPEQTGAPIGFTCGENSEVFLRKAIAAAEKKLEQGEARASDAACGELRFAIDRAKAALGSELRMPQLLDYQIYLLYLTLHGSVEDIGAKFAGFRYEGFDRFLA